ncbi:MAG: hypothetical protein JW990_03805 [Thermoleophilia bacterium]|nr:hypothetical protein [Thermoleophilia bacterium]
MSDKTDAPLGGVVTAVAERDDGNTRVVFDGAGGRKADVVLLGHLFPKDIVGAVVSCKTNACYIETEWWYSKYGIANAPAWLPGPTDAERYQVTMDAYFGIRTFARMRLDEASAVMRKWVDEHCHTDEPAGETIEWLLERLDNDDMLPREQPPETGDDRPIQVGGV